MQKIKMFSECLICEKVYAERVVEINKTHIMAGKKTMTAHGYCGTVCANIGAYGRDDSNEVKPKEVKHGSL